jgi:hypothetical protein
MIKYAKIYTDCFNEEDDRITVIETYKIRPNHTQNSFKGYENEFDENGVGYE